MPRRTKPHRLTVRLDPTEHAEIKRRASAHGIPVAEYVRRATLSGAGAGDSDDEWFAALPPSRQAQVRRWLDKPETVPAPGLLPLPFG